MRKILSLVIPLLILNGCDSDSTNPSSNQEPKPTTGIIAGHIYDSETGSRLSGARISIVGAGTTITTNASGEYRFTGLAPGSYSFMINKNNVGIGRSEFVSVNAGDSNYIPFGLHPVFGNWTMTIQWQGESSFMRNLRLDRNLRFTVTGGSQPSTGDWSLVYDQITMTYPNGTRYVGTVAGSMVGTMLDPDGDPGVWSAVR